MVTLTLTEVSVLVIAIAMAVAVAIFGRLSFQINRTASEVENTARKIGELDGHARELLRAGERDLEEIRVLTRETARIAEDVHAVTGEASALTVQCIRALENNVGERARAAIVGARAGYSALRRARNADSDD